MYEACVTPYNRFDCPFSRHCHGQFLLVLQKSRWLSQVLQCSTRMLLSAGWENELGLCITDKMKWFSLLGRERSRMFIRARKENVLKEIVLLASKSKLCEQLSVSVSLGRENAFFFILCLWRNWKKKKQHPSPHSFVGKHNYSSAALGTIFCSSMS